jgi:hypothetical protein
MEFEATPASIARMGGSYAPMGTGGCSAVGPGCQ